MFALRGHFARYAAVHLYPESYAIVTYHPRETVNLGLRDANREGDDTGGSATRPKLKKRGCGAKEIDEDAVTNRSDLNGRGTI